MRVKNPLFIILAFLILAGAGSAAVVNYVSNSLTATVTIQTQCNDGIDNDGNGDIDIDDPDCHTGGDATNSSSYDICRTEDGTITQCI